MLKRLLGWNTQTHQVKNTDDNKQGDEDAAQRAPQAEGQQVLHGRREGHHCAFDSGRPDRALSTVGAVAAAAVPAAAAAAMTLCL